MRCKFGIVIMIIRRDTCNIRRVHVSRLAKVRERTSLYGTVKNKMLIVLIFSPGLPTQLSIKCTRPTQNVLNVLTCGVERARTRTPEILCIPCLKKSATCSAIIRQSKVECKFFIILSCALARSTDFLANSYSRQTVHLQAFFGEL